jgi:hypothetical protein
MGMRGSIRVLALAGCLLSGFATPYGERLDELRHERDKGKISEEEYQTELENLRESKPWGKRPEEYEKNPKIRHTFGDL